DLETFFTQVFLDVLKGDKLELVRDLTGKISRGARVRQKFLANTNDIALSLLLSWSIAKRSPGTAGERDFLPFRLIAPTGVQVDLTHRTKFGRNTSFTTVHFPLTQNGAAVPVKGEWTVELLARDTSSQELDYHLIVMLDNPTIATDYRIE